MTSSRHESRLPGREPVDDRFHERHEVLPLKLVDGQGDAEVLAREVH
jgi:hypothetical protein